MYCLLQTISIISALLFQITNKLSLTTKSRCGSKVSSAALTTVVSVSLNTLNSSLSNLNFPGLFGWCCFPCQTYQNAEGLDQNGILCALLSCYVPCASTYILRNEARKQYNIEVGLDIDHNTSQFLTVRDPTWRMLLLPGAVQPVSPARLLWRSKSTGPRCNECEVSIRVLCLRHVFR